MLPVTERFRTGDGARPPLGTCRRTTGAHRATGRP